MVSACLDDKSNENGYHGLHDLVFKWCDGGFLLPSVRVLSLTFEKKKKKEWMNEKDEINLEARQAIYGIKMRLE